MKQQCKTSLYRCLGMMAVALPFVSISVAQSTSATPTKPSPAATKAAAPAKPSPKSPDAVKYKDPEDMTTRYRPGNNKTTRVSTDSASSLPATPTTGQAAADADAKKHISTVKYNDREVGIPACDGASKDAAKCASAAPPVPPAAAKPGAAAAQDSKRVNKVDSFTVKQ